MLLIRTIGAAFAVFAFCWYLSVPRKLMFYAAFTGGMNWFIYLAVQRIHLSEMLAIFISALAVGILGHLAAPVLKSPAFVLFLPGILPVIPGMAVYYTVMAVIQNDQKEVVANLMYLLQAVGAISTGVFFPDCVFRIFDHIKLRGNANEKIIQ